MTDLTRAEVAKRIDVNPNTILRWEKQGISPVTPLRDPRTRRLFYPEEKIDAYLSWMSRRVPAIFEKKKNENPTG